MCFLPNVLSKCINEKRYVAKVSVNTSSLVKVRSQLILCSNCGSEIPDVLVSCQFCGTPVPGETNMPKGTNMSGTQAYAPKQPELPAWLETLRSSERPPGPANSGSLYSVDGTIDENALPSWMRSDMMNNAASGKLPAIRPASRPAPNTEGGFVSPVNMSASSLIDQQSLPSWMQEPQTPSQAPLQPLSQVSQQNISAASLVQQEALPTWMKAAPEQQQPATPPIAAQASAPYASPAIPQQGLSGNDLIDQQGLPAWMSGQATGRPAQANGSGEAGAERGMNAGSLIDANALPSWLREGAQQEQRSPNANVAPGILGMGAAPIAPMPASLPKAMQPVQPMQPMQPSNMNNSISASSFVDVDALPSWLRPAVEPRGASGGNAGNNGQPNRSGAFGASARGENMRVPSRPRAEMPSIEESALAANVFASMLGVASATPNLTGPGQQPNESMGRGQAQSGQFPPPAFPVYPAQPVQSPAPSPQSANTGGISNSNWSGFPEGSQSPQMPPMAPPPGYAMPMPQNMGNNQYGQNGQMGQGNQPAIQQQLAMNTFQGNQSNQSMPQRMPGNTFQNNQGNQNYQGNQTSMQQPSGNNVPGKQLTGSQQKQNGKKRGFLDTIMSWFSFSR